MDLSHLKKPKDLLCDDMGSWVCNGNCTAWVMVDEVGDVETLGKSLSEEPSEGMYLVRRKYYYLTFIAWWCLWKVCALFM